MDNRSIILFDGVCNFCNSTVNFVIRRNKKGSIAFATMQSTEGQNLLEKYNLPKDDFSSFVFLDKGKIYTRSTAAFKVCTYLKGLWPLCYALIILPKFIRDGIYNYIARNRYKWFGKQDSCMIPTPELKARFLN